ncbi:hypothetical protein ABEB36_005876 [Hypothenemus hampei]|uniref:RRM domain-containing protein n=1 Tax=Hypothenemus hampei TaxID=57062 RepID=A0ABD1F058_HYPHA
MRRFTQTFVLASQSPKKYYVHNDIFRYQDEIITDEECDGELRPEVEEECLDRPPLNDPQQPLGQPIAPAPGLPFYGGAAVPPAGTALPSLATAPAAPHLLPSQPQITPPSQPAATLNGHREDLTIIQGHISQSVQQPLAAPISTLQPQGVASQQPVETQANEPQDQEDQTDEQVIESAYVTEAEVEQGVSQEPVSNEPKTYANLLKATSGQTQSIYQAQQPTSYRSQSPPSMTSNKATVQSNGVPARIGGGARVTGGSSSRTGGSFHNRGPRNGDEEDRRRSNFGQTDANQLFLGNLPHDATEEELREIFGEFGTVLDLRIHSKPMSVGPKANQSGRTPPNYGFITYDSQTSVVACLAAKPIYYPRNDPTGTPMNVEEKKNKDRDGGRQSYGSSGGRPGLDNNRSGGRGDGQRRGMGPGGPRGGPGSSGTQGPGDRSNRTGDRDNRYNNSGGGGGAVNRGGTNNYNRR